MRPSLAKQQHQLMSFRRFFSIYWIICFLAAVSVFRIWHSVTTVEIPGVTDYQLAETLASPVMDHGFPYYYHISLKPLSETLDKLEPSSKPHFGDLQFNSVGTGKRYINDTHDNLTYEMDRRELLQEMDAADRVVNRLKHYHDDEIEDDPPGQCYRPNWKSKFHPNCNNFHDFDIAEDLSQGKLIFRGEATFRAAWTHDNDWVLKTTQFRRVDHSSLFFAHQKEANIMDVLSKSPRIIDIYGFCGLNTIAEFMPTEAEAIIVRPLKRKQIFELRKRENISGSINDLSSLDVLDISILLAESVADLHGFEGGVIVHGDLNTEQWLINAKGEIKLNDFNNGFVMDWSRRNEEYCGLSHAMVGSFLSVESHLGFSNATEQMDIYGYGSSLYTIMTGSYPYWQYERDDRNKRIQTGKAVPMEPYWRQKNTLDYHLSNLVWDCLEHNFANRPNIFQVIKRLKDMRKLFLTGNLPGRRKKDEQLVFPIADIGSISEEQNKEIG
eukprot:Nitzschia sp. Nitz4//scaffold226_size53432//14630//16120//NITZ4_006695-RA/size53432-processed-gene-0.16-mRNA-1//1//CDS//3329542733//6030//frame0